MTTKKRAATRRAFGTLRKLPSKRWQASYIGPDLQRHAAPVTFAAKIDGEGWLSREARKIADGNWSPPTATAERPQVRTVGDYAADWLAARTLKPRTRSHYRWLLDTYIVPGLGEMPVGAVSADAVRSWYAGLKTAATKKKTGATAKAHAYSLLKAIMATAVEDELIAANPCRIRGAGKAKRTTEVRPATLDELATLTKAMPDRLRLLIQLSAWCALRFGEVTELRRKDVDLKKGVVRIRRGVVRDHGEVIVDDPKTAAGKRPVHVPPHLLPMLKAHLRDHAQIGPEGLLFYAVKSGEQLPHSSLLYRFNLAKDAAGRPDLTPHALRHTGAVLAAQSGATIAELMARLGHTTPTMAMKYQHASEERDLLLAKRLSELANGN
ncbi:tyrosine-type recombinase/integrase [Kribbella swartbergensis]